MEIELSRLSTLSHSARMGIFRLLMRRYPDALPAGEIAGILSLRPSTLSGHLSQLTATGLLSQKRQGTSLTYAVRMDTARSLVGYLFEDCCRGRPDLCRLQDADNGTGTDAMTATTFSVLFICSGNSARSIMAEAILRAEAGDRFTAYSAGTRPNSELNPMAVALLKQKGLDPAPLRSKHVSEFQGPRAPHLDFVFTVCDRAANEECPPWPGQPLTAHWGMPDPAKATGTEAQRRLAFQQAYGALRNRILAFTALPLDTLGRIAIQDAMDEIAKGDTHA